MSFFAIHRSTHASLATDTPWLNPDEWSACASAAELLERLQQLHASHAARLEQALDDARRQGFAAGCEQALQETAERLAAAWQRAAGDAQVEAQSLRDAVLTLSVRLVQHIARDLAAPDIVSALLRRASEELMPDQPAVVRVHPDVADAVRQRLDDSTVLELRADPTLEPLDCVFDTPAGQLIAGWQAQLDRVQKGLLT
jgi:flagellar biosynthesis/type III secretory pathway protein FliH